MRTRKLTFGLELDNELKATAQARPDFIRFIDDKYFEVRLPEEGPTNEDFVYFKRENGQVVV